MDVRTRLSSDTACLSSFEKSVAVSDVCDGVLTLSLDEDTGVLVLSDVERALSMPVLKEVIQLLVVDLEEGAVDCEVIWACVWVARLHGTVVLLLKLAEDVLDRAWDNTKLSFVL